MSIKVRLISFPSVDEEEVIFPFEFKKCEVSLELPWALEDRAMPALGQSDVLLILEEPSIK